MHGMHYGVRVIDDDELPAENAWAMVTTPTMTWFFVKRTRLSAEVLAQGWAAYMLLERLGVLCG